MTPAKIADFLILNRKSPRALITSAEDVMIHLDRLARGYGRSTEAQSRIRAVVGELSELAIEDVFEEGLHEFLSRMIAEVRGLFGHHSRRLSVRRGAMRLRVDHETVYHFDPPMRGVVQSLRLHPTQCENQQVIDWAVHVEGAARGAAFRDGAGDWVETVMLLGPVDRVTVGVAGEVETTDKGGVLHGNRERVPPEAYLRPSRATTADRALEELARDTVSGLSPTAVLDRAHALSGAVSNAIAYTPGQTEHGTTAAEALALGRGVCQDHAHALIAAALVLEIPARYVTGYLFSTEEEGEHEASHAWAELRIPDLGWVGFDASNKTCPDERYIRLGSGADAAEAAPIRGVLDGNGAENLDVRVVVKQSQQ